MIELQSSRLPYIQRVLEWCFDLMLAIYKLETISTPTNVQFL